MGQCGPGSLPSSLHGSSAFALALLVGVAAYVVLVLGDVGGSGYDALRDVFFYNALLVAAALFCLARPVFRRDARVPWTLVGLGLLAWVIGDLYYELAFANADGVPFPSLADGFYLLYPLVYAGLALLLYSRLQDIRTDLWVDGVIAALRLPPSARRSSSTSSSRRRAAISGRSGRTWPT